MTKVAISTSYSTVATGYADLPEGKTWGDVSEWHIKWDTLFVFFKGESDYVEIPLHSDFDTDTKRPTESEVYATDESGETDWETQLE